MGHLEYPIAQLQELVAVVHRGHLCDAVHRIPRPHKANTCRGRQTLLNSCRLLVGSGASLITTLAQAPQMQVLCTPSLPTSMENSCTSTCGSITMDTGLGDFPTACSTQPIPVTVFVARLLFMTIFRHPLLKSLTALTASLCSTLDILRPLTDSTTSPTLQ